jgi:ABC-type sulfate transport system permease component
MTTCQAVEASKGMPLERWKSIVQRSRIYQIAGTYIGYIAMQRVVSVHKLSNMLTSISQRRPAVSSSLDRKAAFRARSVSSKRVVRPMIEASTFGTSLRSFGAAGGCSEEGEARKIGFPT